MTYLAHGSNIRTNTTQWLNGMKYTQRIVLRSNLKVLIPRYTSTLQMFYFAANPNPMILKWAITISSHFTFGTF